jgi:hypothetical protein
MRASLSSEQSPSRRVALTLAVLAAAFLLLYGRSARPPSLAGASAPAFAPAPATWSPSLIGGVPVLVSRPSVPRTGTVLLFHGCQNSAASWVDGPLDAALAAALSARGLMLVAPTAAHGSGCWDASAGSADMAAGAALACALRSATPLFALGASSGGAFATFLAAALPRTFAALACYIMPLHPAWAVVAGDDAEPPPPPLACDAGGAAVPAPLDAPALPPPPPPPLIFVHMPRDARMAAIIAAQRAALAAGCASPPCVAERRVLPTSLRATDFAARMPGRVTAAASKALTAVLLRAGVLGEDAAAAAAGEREPRYAVLEQPRAPKVRSLLLDFVQTLRGGGGGGPLDVGAPEAAGADAPRLDDARASLVRWTQQILNAAFAEHEMTDAFANDVADFLLFERKRV